MKKLHCIICGKYRKFEKPKTSYLLEKTLVPSIICRKCKKTQLRYWKFLVKLKIYNYFKNMCKANMSLTFRVKDIDERRNYFLEKINQNELMSKKHKKVCATLNYIEHFFILTSAINGYISISFFASLISILNGTTSSAIALIICAITAGIKKYRSIIKKKKEKYDKIVLLVKSKLNSMEVLISKALINSVISHDEFVLINNVHEMKREIKNLKT